MSSSQQAPGAAAAVAAAAAAGRAAPAVVGIVGAGAVGSFFAARLALAGHELRVLTRRADEADLLSREGLRLSQAGGDEHCRVRAAATPDILADAGFVLVCVKAGDTEAAGRRIAASLKREAVVLSLQNGMEAPGVLSAVLARPVLPVLVYAAVERPAPGWVRHHGGGAVAVGAGEGAARAQALFQGAGIQAELAGDVRQAAWRKLAINCAWNAVSALADRPYGELADVAAVGVMQRAALAECHAVARAQGVAVPALSAWEEASEAVARQMPAQRSSTAQDVSRGRPTEIDALNGYVVREGARLGVPVPVNATLLALVQALGR